MYRNIFSTLKVLNEYHICNEYLLTKFIDYLGNYLLNKDNDIRIDIYIIESFGYFPKYLSIRTKIWNFAIMYFKNDISHPHILWAYLWALNINTKQEYTYEDKQLVMRLNHIIKRHSFVEPQYMGLIESLFKELKIYHKFI